MENECVIERNRSIMSEFEIEPHSEEINVSSAFHIEILLHFWETVWYEIQDICAVGCRGDV